MSVFAWWTPAGRQAMVLEAIRQRAVFPLIEAVIKCLTCEGWRAERQGTTLVLFDNGNRYEKDIEALLACDWSGLPGGLANDISDIANSNGYCN